MVIKRWCNGESWWGGQLACMASSLVNYVIIIYRYTFTSRLNYRLIKQMYIVNLY